MEEKNKIENEIDNGISAERFMQVVPEKLGFFSRVFGGQKAYDEAMKNANIALGKVQLREKAVNEKEQKVNNMEDEARRKLREADKKLEEANRILAEAKEKESKLSKELEETQEERKIFTEKHEISEDIPEGSVKRDAFVMETLRQINERVQQIKDADEIGVERTEEEKKERNDKIFSLKASLLGIVAAYRDSLPENEIPYVKVFDKSVTSFLQDLAGEIAKEKMEKFEGNYEFVEGKGEDQAKAMETTYISLLKAMKTKTKSKVEDERFYYHDLRSVPNKIMRACLNGKTKVFELKGEEAKQPRSTLNRKEETKVETEIFEVNKEIKDREEER